MRPARSAPENGLLGESCATRCGASMRPARSAPENSGRSGFESLPRHASMRPARSAPENEQFGGKPAIAVRASMRPARSAPENLPRRVDQRQAESGFNEAGAFCAGKRVASGPFRTVPPCFNEAGAFCAGKHIHVVNVGIAHRLASMRPARSAPENFMVSCSIRPPKYCFNEAGAFCAGKRNSHAWIRRSYLTLQ